MARTPPSSAPRICGVTGIPIPAFMLEDEKRDGSEASSSDLEDANPTYKREASPPHEEVLADNPDIAVSDRRVRHVSNRVSL